MSGALSFSLSGMLYVGHWAKEPNVTIHKHFGEWHVCVKEIHGASQTKNTYYKRIVVVCESEDMAKLIADVLGKNKQLLNRLRSELSPGRIANGWKLPLPDSKRSVKNGQKGTAAQLRG